MRRGQGHYIGQFAKILALDTRSVEREFSDTQIDPLRRHPFLDPHRQLQIIAHLQVGLHGLEGGNRIGQEIQPNGRHRRDIQAAPVAKPDVLGSRGQSVVTGKGLLQFLVEHLGLDGGHHAPGTPVKQGHAQRLFQRVDQAADGGLRNAHDFSRATGSAGHHGFSESC